MVVDVVVSVGVVYGPACWWWLWVEVLGIIVKLVGGLLK